MLNLARILNNSWKNFSRNIWLSVATLFMMFAALATIGGLILFNASLDTFVAGLKDKVDVSVYFNDTAEESDIISVKSVLERREDIKIVRYISKNEALDIFTERHSDNEILLESLGELDDNPLQASLNIRVNNPEQFEGVAVFLENSSAASIIDTINFRENQKVIESITSIAASVNRAGVLFTIILAALVIFVTLNTIRLAIYTARDELHIMKLVGASNWFARAPFIVTGAMYGLASGLVVVLFTFLGTWLLHSQISLIFADIDFYGYFIQNFWSFSATIIFSGITMGAVSSYFAVRRYLKV